MVKLQRFGKVPPKSRRVDVRLAKSSSGRISTNGEAPEIARNPVDIGSTSTSVAGTSTGSVLGLGRLLLAGGGLGLPSGLGSRFGRGASGTGRSLGLTRLGSGSLGLLHLLGHPLLLRSRLRIILIVTVLLGLQGGRFLLLVVIIVVLLIFLVLRFYVVDLLLDVPPEGDDMLAEGGHGSGPGRLESGRGAAGGGRGTAARGGDGSTSIGAVLESNHSAVAGTAPGTEGARRSPGGDGLGGCHSLGRGGVDVEGPDVAVDAAVAEHGHEGRLGGLDAVGLGLLIGEGVVVVVQEDAAATDGLDVLAVAEGVEVVRLPNALDEGGGDIFLIAGVAHPHLEAAEAGVFRQDSAGLGLVPLEAGHAALDEGCCRRGLEPRRGMTLVETAVVAADMAIAVGSITMAVGIGEGMKIRGRGGRSHHRGEHGGGGRIAVVAVGSAVTVNIEGMERIRGRGDGSHRGSLGGRIAAVAVGSAMMAIGMAVGMGEGGRVNGSHHRGEDGAGAGADAGPPGAGSRGGRIAAVAVGGATTSMAMAVGMGDGIEIIRGG